MAYEQVAGPSTPGRGLASFERPYESLEQQQQQRHPSGFGRDATSSSFDTSLGRSSSMRNLSAGPSSTGYGFGGMREISTPKSVRWEYAQSTPAPQQPAPAAAAPSSQYQPPSQFPFSLQYSGMQQTSQQQQQQQSYQQSQQQSQPSQIYQSQMQKFQPWSSSNAGPQNQQTTTPNSSFQRSLSSSFSTAGPNQSQVEPSSSSHSVQPTRSAFHNTSSPNTSSFTPLVITKSAQPPAPSSNAQIKINDKLVVASRPAIVSRIKWNVAALVLAWFGPGFAIASRLYWVALDLAYNVIGGDADIHLATTFSWLHRAVLLILAINIVEASILLNTTANSSITPPAMLTEPKRRPSLANPPNRIVSNSSTQQSALLALRSRKNTPHHYAQGSPLRDSIFRASVSAQSLGEGRRLPSQTPRFASKSKQETNATPLAAFLARKQEYLASGGDVGDVSWNGDADISTDSIEVDRALRAFSAGYEREMSQSRTIDSEARKSVIAV